MDGNFQDTNGTGGWETHVQTEDGCAQKIEGGVCVQLQKKQEVQRSSWNQVFLFKLHHVPFEKKKETSGLEEIKLFEILL